MSEKPLEPGEIGVLCNLPDDILLKNGMLAEVVGVRDGYSLAYPGSYEGLHFQIKPLAPMPPLDDLEWWGCRFHEIRRITDPDATQSTDTEREVSA